MRRPVATDLGVSVIGQVMPHPDMAHGPTVAAGLAKRVGAKLPDPCPSMLDKAEAFTRWLVKDRFEPLPADTDYSRTTWLKYSKYPLWKKEMLAAQPKYEMGCVPDFEFRFCSFVKDEFYAEIKHSRSIQGPSDALKAHFGPYISAMEHIVFKNKEFVKQIPVSERPKLIMEMFGNGLPVGLSDFSSFEVSWQRRQMEAFELPLIEHMLQNMPGYKGFMRDLRRCEVGVIRLVFKYVTATIRATRKSGTPNTSFSNGTGNWLIHEFAGHELGLGKLNGIFEGDDGMFNYESGKFPTPEFYEKLGFVVKLEVVASVTEASFCGMVFDSTEQVAVWDPVNFITKLGWGSARYLRAKDSTKKALLRCKALSLAAQCPRAPVLAACADWILRCTSGIDTRKIMESRNTGWWERQSYLRGTRFVDRTDPGLATRQLVADKFGLSVSAQLELEAWFDAQKTLCQIPAFWNNPLWADMDENYTRELSVAQLDCYPVFPDQPCEYPRILTHDGDLAIKVIGLCAS